VEVLFDEIRKAVVNSKKFIEKDEKERTN